MQLDQRGPLAAVAQLAVGRDQEEQFGYDYALQSVTPVPEPPTPESEAPVACGCSSTDTEAAWAGVFAMLATFLRRRKQPEPVH